MCLQVIDGDWNISKGTKLSIALQSHTGQTQLNSATYAGTNPAINGNSFGITVVAGSKSLVLNFDAEGELDLVTAIATCIGCPACVLASTMSRTSSGLIINFVGV